MRKRSLLLFTLMISLSLAAPVSSRAADMSDNPVLYSGGTAEGTEADTTTDTSSDTSSDTSDTQDTEQYTTDSSAQDTSTADTNDDASQSETLDVEDDQGTFTTTLMQGQNRFEIFYTSSVKIPPSLVFEVNGQSYEAEYGKRTEDSDPVKTLKGEDITITPTGQVKTQTLSMLAVYFDTSKVSGSIGAEATVTVNLNGSDIFIITRTQPTVRSQITDGDETRQKIYPTSDPGYLLKYYSSTEGLLGAEDIVNIIHADNATEITPTVTKPKKKDPMKARIALGILVGLIATAIILLL
ncbi:MAG: hypothetical protein ACI4CS_00165, partial [Candidatus Weimeria sp.]